MTVVDVVWLWIRLAGYALFGSQCGGNILNEFIPLRNELMAMVSLMPS